MSQEEFSKAIELLNHPQSAKRRSGAKKLRKLKDSSAGPYLLTALKKEINDKRTWETQYHMIMALGECKYKESILTLNELTQKHFEATMIYLAIGDALVRLLKKDDKDAKPILELIRSNNEFLIEGGLRAMAILRMIPAEEDIDEIISYVRKTKNNSLIFWTAASCPGWKTKQVHEFLSQCSQSEREDIRKAAVNALKGKYLNWKPL